MGIALSTMLDALHTQGFVGGAYFSGTTTSAGSATTAVDSGLYSRFTRNNEVRNLWVLLTSGTYSGSKRLIWNGASDAYTASTGTMTWLSSLAGNSGNAVTYQIHSIDPQYKIDALNAARLLCSKYVSQQFTDYLITNSPIPNPCFTWWNSAASLPVGWASSNAALTPARVSGPNNNFVCKLTSSDATERWISTAPTYYADSLALAGKDISIYCDMYSDTASHARIGVSIDGSLTSRYSNQSFDYDGTTATAAFHAGDSLWYRMQRETIAVPSTLAALDFRILIASATAITHASKFYIRGGPQVKTYPFVGNWLGDPEAVFIQSSPDLTRKGFESSHWDAVRFGFEEVDTAPNFASTGTNRVARLTLPKYSDGYLVKVQGKAPLSSVSAMTDTMEVDNDTFLYVAAKTQQVLYERLMLETDDDADAEKYKRLAELGFLKAQSYEDNREHGTQRRSGQNYPVSFR